MSGDAARVPLRSGPEFSLSRPALPSRIVAQPQLRGQGPFEMRRICRIKRRRPFAIEALSDLAHEVDAVQRRVEGQDGLPITAQRDRMLPEFHVVEEFFAAAAADLSNAAALHKMRIAGKRLRYAMELLAGAFDDAFRAELYPIYTEVQDQLGIINDHVTAIAMFSQWLARAKNNGNQTKLINELAELIVNEEKQLDATSQSFREWWTAERAAELKARFDAVSTSNAAADNSQALSAPPDGGHRGGPLQSQEPTNDESEAVEHEATTRTQTE